MTDDMVRVEDLLVARPSFDIREVSFAIPRGRVVGLVGPNGAGKTSVIRSLLGLMAPDAGRIEILGHAPGAKEALSSTGVVLDNPTAAADWRVSSLPRRIGPFYPRWDDTLFAEMLDRFDVPTGQRIGELSRGQGVKLSLAAALAQRPELLILDEPSSGLDPASRREIANAIRHFMIDPAHATLFSTHITSDLDDLADELIVLVRGRIAHRGPLPEVKESFAVARGAGNAPVGTIGAQTTGEGWSALIRMEDSARFGSDVVIDEASIDDIIVHMGADEEEVAA